MKLPAVPVPGPLAGLAARAAARRRWNAHLRGLTLDPDLLPRPVAEPGPRDFIMCGCPRSGTTLLCAALFQPQGVVTVMEPWDGMRMPPAELFASLRRELAETGRLRRGKLDLDALGGGDVRWDAEGAVRDVPWEEDSLLGVKWPAFWRYLDLLPTTRFLVCIRHPVEVVASFKKHGGRLTEGLEYDIAFNRRLNRELGAATRDRALRRVLLYDHVNRHVLPHLDRPNVLPVRYERWFTDRERLLGEIGAFLGTELRRDAVAIREPRSRGGDTGLTPREMQLLAEHCTTAAALGYDVSALPAGKAG